MGLLLDDEGVAVGEGHYGEVTGEEVEEELGAQEGFYLGGDVVGNNRRGCRHSGINKLIFKEVGRYDLCVES